MNDFKNSVQISPVCFCLFFFLQELQVPSGTRIWPKHLLGRLGRLPGSRFAAALEVTTRVLVPLPTWCVAHCLPVPCALTLGCCATKSALQVLWDFAREQTLTQEQQCVFSA